MGKKSKKYRAALEKVDRTKKYAIDEAVALLKDISFEGFDASVEVSLDLNVNPRKADQNIRGAMVLPHGTGKTKRVLVFAKGEKAKEAEDAGADFVGDEELVEKILGGWMEFDTVVATPDMMPKVGKLGRTLGPRGLMPNPKTGTVTQDIKKAVGEIKAGKVEYRVDKAGILNIPVGRRSFASEKIIENLRAFYETIQRSRPATVKGIFVRNMAIATTMSPGIKVDTTTIL